MSFSERKACVEEGDEVILYLNIDKILALKAVPTKLSKKGQTVENVFQVTPFGALRAKDLIGQRYGTKVKLSNGWGYILQPTPELWTLTLPHRTQIIYTPDISMIVMYLDLEPGSIVVESGTGSASLSHALIRTIKPSGHLYTYDFHEQRVEKACEEFKEHGFSDFVTCQQQDVCEKGFPEQVHGVADAVFLDLPEPWLAIEHAVKCFKSVGGRLCTFSPCIEQVQKSCETLRNLDFKHINTIEVLQTQYTVQKRSLPVVKLDYLKVPKTEDDQEQNTKESIKITTALPPSRQAGHTGYLTFATFLPIWARKKESDVLMTE